MPPKLFGGHVGAGCPAEWRLRHCLPSAGRFGRLARPTAPDNPMDTHLPTLNTYAVFPYNTADNQDDDAGWDFLGRLASRPLCRTVSYPARLRSAFTRGRFANRPYIRPLYF